MDNFNTVKITAVAFVGQSNQDLIVADQVEYTGKHQCADCQAYCGPADCEFCGSTQIKPQVKAEGYAHPFAAVPGGSGWCNIPGFGGYVFRENGHFAADRQVERPDTADMW